MLKPVPIRLLAPLQQKGDLLTDLVAELLVAQGFQKPARNLALTGRELDLLAEHRRDEGRRAAVECKATGQPIGGDAINKFIGLPEMEHDGTAGYFVSLAGFTETARAQVRERKRKVILLDAQGLLDELVASGILRPAHEVAERAGRSVPPAEDELIADPPQLLGHERGWFWAVPFRRDGERTHVALVQGKGAPLSEKLARELLALTRELGGDLHELTYLPPPAGRAASPSAKAIVEAERRYLQFLAHRYQFLQMKGMGISEQGAVQLALLDLYIPLTVRVGSPTGETWERFRLAGGLLGDEEKQALGGETSERVPVLDLLRKHPGVVIKGDPGSGKTTLLKYLAVSYAQGKGGGLKLGKRLPVLLPLAACAGEVGKVSFVEFFDRYARREIDVDLPFGALLERALAEGRALLLFDGLDEVRDEGARRGVVHQVEGFFSSHSPAGNRFVLTSRIVGYVPPTAEGLIESTLLDLEESDIESFLEKWTTRAEILLSGENPESHRRAKAEREGLLRSIRDNEGIGRLAANPLMLTMLARMKRQGVELPERRVELYKSYVEVLLKHWHLERSLAPQAIRSLPRGNDKVIQRRLASLALWMQETSPGHGQVDEGAMRRKLSEILAADGEADPEIAVDAFLSDVRLDSSLLVERGHRKYGFLHLSFQEFLAAVALARQVQDGKDVVAAALAWHLGEPDWHEVILLTLGHLAINQELGEAAGEIAEALIGDPDVPRGAAVALAGQALVDAGSELLFKVDRGRLLERLLATIRDERVEAKRRVAAGRVLAKLGDPRPEVMTLAGMAGALCLVPAGKFLMGSWEELQAVLKEPPRPKVETPYLCRMARYPVTAAQYREYLGKVGLDMEGRQVLRDPPSCPARDVTWEEAVAFCRWLTAAWREEGRIGQEEIVSLPSEAEWERAALGVDGRIFPWGDEPAPNRANCRDTGIDDASPAGCFPGGRAGSGCEELVGNVWEWTADYPYKRSDGREGMRVARLRVVRGGSFDVDFDFARAAGRFVLDPSARGRGIGFRVVVRPFSSEP